MITDIWIHSVCRFCGRKIRKSRLGTDGWVHDCTGYQECPSITIAAPIEGTATEIAAALGYKTVWAKE